MDTLKSYIDRMGEQIASGALVADNEALLEEVRSVASLGLGELHQYCASPACAFHGGGELGLLATR